ncbi:hypothetical protein BJ166DRAFT_513461 [Pestalotiopsis sp. NC0098]|nr:hypothetical protein BJ166DRAFT_513461 [Pestalotiopsis sp. NC0098]
MRFWVRTHHARDSLALDDLFMCLGTLVVLACTAMQYYNTIYGMGGSVAASPVDAAEEIIASRKIDWCMIVIEKPAFGFIKLSILFFYRRIFGIWPNVRRLNTALISLVAAWTLAFLVADLLLCGIHPELNWAYDQRDARRGCGNKGALLLSFAATSVATDAILVVLPFFYIRRLQMPKSKKLAVVFVFFLGTASTAASVLRVIFLSIAYPLGRLDFGYSSPPGAPTPLVLQVFNPTFWVMVELWLGIWAANLPPCAPLLKDFHPYQRMRSRYAKVALLFSSKSARSG